MAGAHDRLTEVVNHLMALPHVVSNIIHYARTSRPTLARLMRTNTNFYAEAGPVLYDTVTVWEKNFELFFHGVFDPAEGDISAFSAPICDFVDTERWEHTHFPRFDNPRARRWGSTCDDTGNTLPFSKKELLSFVRVLTLGSHHASSCARFYVPFLKYMTNVEVFRIVDTPVYEAITALVCGNIPTDSVPKVPCPIISAINPRKLVLRNLSYKTIPFPPLWSLNDKTKEVVLVFPTVEAYIHDPVVSPLATALRADLQNHGGLPSRMIWSFSGQFHAADTIKIVFWPEWDYDVTTKREARRVLAPEFEPPKKKVDRSRALPADTMGILVSLCKGTRHADYTRKVPGPGDHKPEIKFFGIGSLNLTEGKRSMLVRQYRVLTSTLEGPDLHTLVKLEAFRSDKYMIAAMPATKGRQIMMLSCPDVKLYTIGNYKRGPREAEISQWD